MEVRPGERLGQPGEPRLGEVGVVALALAGQARGDANKLRLTAARRSPTAAEALTGRHAASQTRVPLDHATYDLSRSDPQARGALTELAAAATQRTV